jgi:hypothetical protein
MQRSAAHLAPVAPNMELIAAVLVPPDSIVPDAAAAAAAAADEIQAVSDGAM